jgi:type I restriction enzyme M protein
MNMPKPKKTSPTKTKRERRSVLLNAPTNAPTMSNAPTTTKSQLSSVIKSARDIMRKDAGLNGDLDRLPQLSWVLFLKSYDDLELRREQEAVMRGESYKPVISKGYRWRDWAADENKGHTGEDLIKFVNDDLLPKLRALNGSDERQTIAEVFKETFNRFLSGFLLRDVVNLVNRINFNSSDDIHTLSHLYESMLKEMRDAAGDSGEFYTPRPVVRFIVERVKPKLGDKILDPACGTGGFLVEAYNLLEKQQCTVEDRETLQSKTLYGVEKKPMPFLLGMMNLLLHGVDRPNLRRDNALKNPLREITEKDRVHVIVTNPPFGGEEERGIQLNFPEATRTSETALLFMQFIMRSLKEGGRCGMVVPNGTLFGDGVAARVKEQLLNEFNLHTIVRLPNGVFAPYTSIPTNLLFFDKPCRDVLSNIPATTQIWYYELALPEGRKNYTKTAPMQDAEFDECRALWDKRELTARSWMVEAKEVAANSFNLDIKNPNRVDDYEHMPPEKLVADIAAKETRIAAIMAEIEETLRGGV